MVFLFFMENLVDIKKKINRWTFGKTFIFREYYHFSKPDGVKNDIDVKKEVDLFFIYQSKIKNRFEKDFDNLEEAIDSWKIAKLKIDPGIYFSGFYKPKVSELKEFKSCLEDLYFYLTSSKYNNEIDSSISRSFGERFFAIGGLSAMYCAIEIVEKFTDKNDQNTIKISWKKIGDSGNGKTPGIDFWY